MDELQVVAWRKTHRFASGRVSYTVTENQEAAEDWAAIGKPLEPLALLSEATARIAALEESELAAHNLSARLQLELDAAKADRDSWAKQASDRVDDAVRFAQEVEALRLPASYGGSTFAAWGDQVKGCTLHLHFNDAKQAEAWFNAIRSRSGERRRGT